MGKKKSKTRRSSVEELLLEAKAQGEQWATVLRNLATMETDMRVKLDLWSNAHYPDAYKKMVTKHPEMSCVDVMMNVFCLLRNDLCCVMLGRQAHVQQMLSSVCDIGSRQAAILAQAIQELQKIEEASRLIAVRREVAVRTTDIEPNE